MRKRTTVPACALLSCMTRREEALFLVCSFERFRTRQESLPCAGGKSNSLFRILTFSHCLVSVILPLGVRKYPSNPQPASLPAIPRGVPVDYFDPAYFRTVLTAYERESYRNTGVCLPAINHDEINTIDFYSDGTNSNTLSFVIATLELDQEDFLEHYGQRTQMLYF